MHRLDPFFFAVREGKAADARFVLCVDRDGALIEEKHYLSDPAQVKFTPDAVPALRRAKAAGAFIAIISNQAGLAKGKFGMADLEAVTRTVLEACGDAIDCAINSPFHPEGTVAEFAISCDSRKPGIGMYRYLQKRYALPDVPRFMIGDKLSDLDFGSGIGGTSYLVATGYGHRDGAARGKGPEFATLADAVDEIIASR